MRSSSQTFLVRSGIALVVVTLWALAAGTGGLHWPDAELLYTLRLPRVVCALFAGAALAVSGAVCQTLARNALAEPFILGVSGGAAVGGVLASALCVGASVWVMAGACLAGALVSVLFVFSSLLGLRTGDSILLSGLAFNAFASAVITLVKTLSTPSTTQEILFWLVGSVSSYAWPFIALCCAVVVVVLAWLLRQGERLDLLSFGDDEAQLLGLDVRRFRLGLYAALTLLVAVIVSWVGMIGFVGLVVPHFVRLRLGPAHRRLMVACALWGALLLVGADALCRLSFHYVSTELPVGALTAILGAPYLMYALRQQGAADGSPRSAS